MSLLKKYRSREKLTKVLLAKKIKKTDAYVRKLENDGYTPPVYKVCQQLADAFNLTDDERTDFIHQAFLGRIRSEKEFFAYLYPEKKPTRPRQGAGQAANSKKGAAPKLGHLTTSGPYEHQCVFQITWTTASEKITLDSECAALLDQSIISYNDTFKADTHTVDISERSITISVSIPPTIAPADFVESLKTHCSEKLRSNFPKTFSQKNIWGKSATLTTYGQVRTPELAVAR